MGRFLSRACAAYRMFSTILLLWNTHKKGNHKLQTFLLITVTRKSERFSAAPTFGFFHLFHYTCKYRSSTGRNASLVTKIARGEKEIYERVVQEKKKTINIQSWSKIVLDRKGISRRPDCTSWCWCIQKGKTWQNWACWSLCPSSCQPLTLMFQHALLVHTYIQK